jgi:hypothetical protein
MMAGHDHLLEQRLTAALNLVARPYSCGEALALEVQARLWQLGVPCSELTPRDEVVSRLWAKKRGVSPGRFGPGPSAAPPAAA